MFTIISSVLLLAAAVILLVIARSNSKTDTSSNDDRYNEDSSGPSPKTLRIIAFSIFGVIPIFYFMMSAISVDSGEVKVARLFGKVQNHVLTEGLHFMNPLISWESVNIQRNSIQVQDGDSSPGMNSTTKDNITATVQANFTFMVNPEYAWWITKHIGKTSKVVSELLEKAAQSATRDALAHFKLEEAQITKRDSFEVMLSGQFLQNILINLPKNELSEDELKKVFVILPTQLMEITPDPKVANALSEKKATEITLDQQKTLTAIAMEQANRRKEEGTGIRKLFDELPANRTAGDVALILNATANKTRADAFMKAVTDGKVSFGVFEGEASRVSK